MRDKNVSASAFLGNFMSEVRRGTEPTNFRKSLFYILFLHESHRLEREMRLAKGPPATIRCKEDGLLFWVAVFTARDPALKRQPFG